MSLASTANEKVARDDGGLFQKHRHISRSADGPPM